MEIQLPHRVSITTLLLGAALVAMAVSIIGAPLSLLTLPLMRAIESRANSMLHFAATLLNALTISLVLLALRYAARGPSLLAANAAVFAAARVVAVVYLAELVVVFAQAEIRGFFQVSFFNATQIDVHTMAGGMFMTMVLPLIGTVLLIVVAPRILSHRFR